MEKERIGNAIETAGSLEEKYELSMEGIERIEEEFKDFRVYIPLIGRFSAGKSALINNLLGMGTEVCREDIQVATAIPMEVFYGDEDIACICRGEKEFISMERYMEIREELSVDNADVIKLQISDNEVLECFPSIALVDMPGLDSGYEVHDRAVEEYIRRSMAYVLVFPADELIIPESMEKILHDLDSYDMPVCAVITKGNRMEGAKKERKARLQQELAKYFPGRDIPVFITERDTGDLGGFVEYLADMEKKAGDMGKAYYKRRLEPEFSRITNYLSGYIKNMELSLSELEEEQDRLQNDMAKLQGRVSDELDEFSGQVPALINSVAMDVQAALSGRMDEMVFELIHDNDVAPTINEIVRSALNSSYQDRVMGNIRKHLDKIADTIALVSANYASAMKIDVDRMCGMEISGVGRTAIDVIGLILGGPIGAIVAHVFTGLVNQNNSEKRREAEARVRQQLTSKVFPEVDREVRGKLEMDLNRISMEIRHNVRKDVDAQMDSLQKSLNEVIARRQEEDQIKGQRRAEIEGDIRLLEEAKRGVE